MADTQDQDQSSESAGPMEDSPGDGTPSTPKGTKRPLIEAAPDSAALVRIKSRHQIMEKKRLEAEETRRRELEQHAEREAKRQAKRAEKRRKQLEDKKARMAEQRRKSKLLMDRTPSKAKDVHARLGSPVPSLQAALDAAGGAERQPVQLTPQQQEEAARIKAGLADKIKEAQAEHERLLKEKTKLLVEKRKLTKAREKALAKNKQHQHERESRAGRYPMEDSLLALEPPLVQPLPDRPLLVKRLAVDPTLAAGIIRVRDFLYNFKQTLSLSPFSVDDLTDAVQYQGGPTVLLTEVHTALLSLILRDGRGQKMLSEASRNAARPTDTLGAALKGTPVKEGNKKGQPLARANSLTGKEASSAVAEAGLVPVVEEQHASALVTPLTWQALLRPLLPQMGPFARGVLPSTQLPQAKARKATLRSMHQHLGEREYHDLPAEEKVALLEVLVDAAYESKRIRNLLEENMEQRITLEANRREDLRQYKRDKLNEERLLKEKAVELLREDLLKEFEKAQAEARKQQDIRGFFPGAQAGGEGTDEAGNGRASPQPTSDMDVAEPTAEEGKAEADKAAAKKSKGPKKKTKAGESQAAGTGDAGEGPRPPEPTHHQISLKAAQLLEQDACGGREFYVHTPPMSLEDLPEEQEEEAADREPEPEGLSRLQMLQWRKDREEVRREKARQREDRRRQAQLISVRQRALESVVGALKKDDSKSLQEAITQGRQAGLEGEDHQGKRWMHPKLKEAYLSLHQLKERIKRAGIIEKYNKLLEAKFVRTAPIGRDRFGRRYWALEGDGRVYVEQVLRRPDAPPHRGKLVPHDTNVPDTMARLEATSSGGNMEGKENAGVLVAAGEQKPVAAGAVLPNQDDMDVEEPQYHWEDHAIEHYYSTWWFYDSEEEFHDLILSLDARGVKELSLKEVLQERFDLAELQKTVDQHKEGQQVEWKTEGHEFVGQMVKRLFERQGFAVGRIVGWIPAEDNEGLALWHVKHTDGDEEDLEEDEARQAVALAQAELQEGVELDPTGGGGASTGDFLKYTNKLKRAVGGVREGDLGLEALRAELLVREAAMSAAIKDKNKEYARGGNAAPRSLWLHDLKEAEGIQGVREALLSLEATLHQLQEGEDVVEGWQYDKEAHPAINTKVRRFINGQLFDGVVEAYLPAKGHEAQLWRVRYEDEDVEELEKADLEKAQRDMADNVLEPPDDEEETESEKEQDVDDAGSEAASDEEDYDSQETESEDEVIPGKKTARRTLWPNWGAWQRWLRAMQAAQTSSALALGFVSLVETATAFGMQTQSIVGENRSRARRANAWQQQQQQQQQQQGEPGKGGRQRPKRAAAAAAPSRDQPARKKSRPTRSGRC